MSSKKTNKNKIQNTLIGALIIGILGSAIWEKIISPLSSYIFFKISNIFSNMEQNFSDSLYRQISSSTSLNGFESVLSLIFFMLLLTCLILCKVNKRLKNLIMITKYGESYITYLEETDDDFSDYDDGKFALFKNSIAFLICMIILTFTLMISTLYMTGKITFIQKAKTNTLANIEIVSPYIEDIEYKTLKSNFYSISSEDDFNNLTNELQSIAEENNIKLK